MLIPLALPCPLCGLDLTALQVGELRTISARDTEVGRHVHLRLSGTVACVNNHQWNATNTFLLERIL